MFAAGAAGGLLGSFAPLLLNSSGFVRSLWKLLLKLVSCVPGWKACSSRPYWLLEEHAAGAASAALLLHAAECASSIHSC